MSRINNLSICGKNMIRIRDEKMIKIANHFIEDYINNNINNNINNWKSKSSWSDEPQPNHNFCGVILTTIQA